MESNPSSLGKKVSVIGLMIILLIKCNPGILDLMIEEAPKAVGTAGSAA